tara:strand:- start:157 stop:681 length:525 start_codon:yes stop_codon:yes gene_type:complete
MELIKHIWMLAVAISIASCASVETSYVFRNQSDNLDAQVFDVQNGRYYNQSGDLVFALRLCSSEAVCFRIDGTLGFFLPGDREQQEWSSGNASFRNLGETRLDYQGAPVSGDVIVRTQGEYSVLYFYSTNRGLMMIEFIERVDGGVLSLAESSTILADGENAYVAEQSGFLAFR